MNALFCVLTLKRRESKLENYYDEEPISSLIDGPDMVEDPGEEPEYKPQEKAKTPKDGAEIKDWSQFFPKVDTFYNEEHIPVFNKIIIDMASCGQRTQKIYTRKEYRAKFGSLPNEPK